MFVLKPNFKYYHVGLNQLMVSSGALQSSLVPSRMPLGLELIGMHPTLFGSYMMKGLKVGLSWLLPWSPSFGIVGVF